MRKPVIGILCAKHDMGKLLPYYGTNAHYPEQVRAAGAVPVQLSLHPGYEDSEAWIDLCDGFLFPGGGDFDPDWYGEALLPNLQPDSTAIDRESQALALTSIRKAAASGKPILGVCLGMQVLNVALGGSLYQDIPTQIPSEVCHRGRLEQTSDRWQIAHTVRLEAGSRIHAISSGEEIRVNSFHHQAVKEIAPGFRPTAWAPDGVVEAIERGNILGIQWHPENLSHAGMPEAQAIFRWLAETAAEGI